MMMRMVMMMRMARMMRMVRMMGNASAHLDKNCCLCRVHFSLTRTILSLDNNLGQLSDLLMMVRLISTW